MMVNFVLCFVCFQSLAFVVVFFFFQAEDGIRDGTVTGVQTCALPICCENNRYGMGTAFERVAAVTDVVEHACSYDLAAELVNGMDALAVYEATTRAVDRARKGGHPTLLEVRTYRYMGHSMSDPLHGVYRTKEEVEEQRQRDPITQMAHKLISDGVLDQAGVDALDAAVRAEVEAAVQFADQSPDPEPGALLTDVLAE